MGQDEPRKRPVLITVRVLPDFRRRLNLAVHQVGIDRGESVSQQQICFELLRRFVEECEGEDSSG